VYRTRLPGGDVPTGGSGLPLAATPGPSPAPFSHTREAWSGPAVRDTVLASVPAAGDEVRAGAVIALRAASGLNTVPVVTGMVPAEAQGALTTAGFSSRVAVGGLGVPGVVAETAPGSGQVAAVGSVVVLRIPPEASATPSASASPTLTPPPSSTPTDMPPATEPPRP